MEQAGQACKREINNWMHKDDGLGVLGYCGSNLKSNLGSG